MKKRVISVLLALVLVLSMAGVWSVEAQAYSPAKTQPELSGVTAVDVANIARSQVGYIETNGTVYGSWWNGKGYLGNTYTYGSWCAMFACWCMGQAGVPMGSAYDSYSAEVMKLYNLCKTNGLVDTTHSTDPQPGDLLFFSNKYSVKSLTHVAVVIAYDKTTKRVTYVGGNETISRGTYGVKQSTLTWRNGSKAVAYGRPNYGGSRGCSHQYGEWQSAGTVEMCAKYRTCTICGYVQPYCTSLTHSYSSSTSTATCTTPGGTTQTCSGCGDVKVSNYVSALGHSVNWNVLKEATITEEGHREGTCDRCGQFVSEIVPTLELPFGDVARGIWFESAVRYVYSENLMAGTGATSFAPDVTTSRAMLATVLWRLEGSPIVEEATNTFEDLTDNWYIDAVNWAYENGIIQGMSETAFAPTEPVTRQQAAAMLYRYCEMKGCDVSGQDDLSKFPDGMEVQEYAQEPLSWAVNMGLIKGMADPNNATILAPDSDTTRAQMATILMRLCKNIL